MRVDESFTKVLHIIITGNQPATERNVPKIKKQKREQRSQGKTIRKKEKRKKEKGVVGYLKRMYEYESPNQIITQYWYPHE